MKKRIIAGIMAAALCVGSLAGCKSEKKTINIYSTSEDFANENARKMLNEKFPDYDINVVDIDTGSLAAKLAAEGKESEIDIILELETTYMERCKDSLATLDDVDLGVYVDDQIPEHKKYVPWTLYSGSIIIDKKALDSKGVAMPASYEDLLKPEYKGLISMPNPKSSGTGYMFLLNLVNERGEDAAFEYFNKLADNMSGAGFTTSGSGPIKAILQGEAAIALGMTFQAAVEIEKGTDLTIVYFDEGAPYATTSSAIVSGKEKNKAVMEVFKYIVSDVSPKDKELYHPEVIFKGQEISMKDFPETIPYGNMDGLRDMDKKEALLDKWNH